MNPYKGVRSPHPLGPLEAAGSTPLHETIEDFGRGSKPPGESLMISRRLGTPGYSADRRH